MAISVQEILERQRKEQELRDWQTQRTIDALLQEGVDKGLTFAEFHDQTQAPFMMKGRYEELQRMSGIAPGSVSKNSKPDPFLAGFNKS